MIDKIIKSEIILSVKDPKKLKELLDLELERKKYNRSESKIIITNKELKIEIYAKDIIALKATFSNYISLLELINKVYEVDL